MEKGAYLRNPSIPLRFELDITTVDCRARGGCEIKVRPKN